MATTSTPQKRPYWAWAVRLRHLNCLLDKEFSIIRADCAAGGLESGYSTTGCQSEAVAQVVRFTTFWAGGNRTKRVVKTCFWRSGVFINIQNADSKVSKRVPLWRLTRPHHSICEGCCCQLETLSMTVMNSPSWLVCRRWRSFTTGIISPKLFFLRGFIQCWAYTASTAESLTK